MYPSYLWSTQRGGLKHWGWGSARLGNNPQSQAGSRSLTLPRFAAGSRLPRERIPANLTQHTTRASRHDKVLICAGHRVTGV